MNKVFINGRVTDNVELKATQTGKGVARFTVAEKKFNQEKPNYHSVTAWNGVAENCAKYLEKGQEITLIGEIRYGSYEKNGTKIPTTNITITDIEFGSKPKSQPNDAFEDEINNLLGDDDLPY